MAIRRKCWTCKYAAGEFSTLGRYCNYAFITGRSRLRQVYRELGISYLNDEARKLMSGEHCRFYEPLPGAKADEEKIRARELYRERMREVKRESYERMMGRGPERKRSEGPGEKYNWVMARRLYNEGKTDREIARELGCRTGTVNAWRHREGLAAHGNVPKYDKARALELVKSGATEAEVARELGCSKSAVKSWKRRAGLTAPRKKADGETIPQAAAQTAPFTQGGQGETDSHGQSADWPRNDRAARRKR